MNSPGKVYWFYLVNFWFLECVSEPTGRATSKLILLTLGVSVPHEAMIKMIQLLFIMMTRAPKSPFNIVRV